jgi:hypothetical protein
LVGRMVRIGVISLAEANFFKYEITTVFRNTQVLEYLKWFEEHCTFRDFLILERSKTSGKRDPLGNNDYF